MKMKLLKLKHTPTRFMSFLRRNQLMLLVTGTFLMVLFIALFALSLSQRGRSVEQQRRNESRQQVARIEALSEQLKSLSEENNRLADRNIFYSKCGLRLFAEWTRTRQPIKFQNVYKCEAVRIKDDGSTQRIIGTPELPVFLTDDYQQKNNSQDKPQLPSEPPTKPEQPEEEMNPLESLLNWVGNIL